MSDLKQKEGYIVFCNTNIGSKSEHFAPYLIQENGESIPVFFKDDNPFEHNALAEYHLRFCIIEGAMDDKNETFIISKVTEKQDPYKNTNKQGQKDEPVQ